MDCLHGDYRGSVEHLGPRVLTFPGQIPTPPQSNCPTCPNSANVTGEGGGPAQLLVHGWYLIQTDSNIFVSQVSPDDACTVDPVTDGIKILAGEERKFFVSCDERDGVIVVVICTAPTAACGTDAPDTRPEGTVRVNRIDTIQSMQDTGNDADLPAPPISKACTPTAP